IVIGKGRIFVQILLDLFMLIEKTIHVLKFLLAQVIVRDASTSVAVPIGSSIIAIGSRPVPIQSIAVHVAGVKLIFPADEGGRILAHFLSHRRMLSQKLAEILVALEIALIVDEFRFLFQ